jgi:adenosylhomocysteine nucleosidase
MTALILSILLSMNQPTMVGVMSAMEIELEFISSDLVHERTDTIASMIYEVGRIHDLPCVMVHSGIGKVGAAQTAQILIMQYGVDAVIFTGVAGGINPQLCIGDIVISENVVHHDFGQIMQEHFVPFDTVGFSADSTLVRLAMLAAQKIEFEPIPEEIRGEEDKPRVLLGRVATGDQFISSEAKRIWLEQIFGADCVEMEGAAVAQVCASNKVPFVIIRSLSDLADEDADVDFQRFVVFAAKNSSMLVKEILKLLGGQSR